VEEIHAVKPVTYKDFIITKHAARRKLERDIYISDIEHVLSSGEVIEEYPEDTPYPSRLVLGFIDRRPIHIVAADNDQDRITYIITVYEPNTQEWDSSFRRRLKP